MNKLCYALAAALCLISVQCLAESRPLAGKSAPDFTLESQEGKNVSLHQFHGKWVVLYFYPKDFTHGCSLEAHNFQSDIEKYRKLNAVIVGVSVDSKDSHKQFCTKEGLDFKLLADDGHNVSHLYGSVMNHNGEEFSSRSTFLIDPSGVIRKVYPKVNPAGHSAEVLSDLGRLTAKSM